MALISPGRAWWLARRDWQRGPAATWHDYVTCDRLPARWRNPARDLPPEDVPVCLLTGRTDLRLALWMLASWFHFTRRHWRVIAHDDGTLRPEDAALLRRLFPHVIVRMRDEADRAMEKILRPYPAARAYRASHVLARKAFDIPALSVAGPFILLDSDLLFFAEPREILDWVETRPGTCWFNEDVAEACELNDADVFRQYGFHLWPRVNSGLCLLQSEAIDFAAMERWLTENRLGHAPGTLWRVEQTLLALAASRLGRGGLLPPAYEVSLGRSAAPGCVMRHYVGAVRQRFFGEGLARLAPILLAA